MAFNFGAFLGGFSQAVSQNIQLRDKRKYEEERLKEEREYEESLYEKRLKQKEASEAASRRRAEQKAAEERIGSLVSLGYDIDAATEIAKGGKYAAERAIQLGEKAWERNINPAELYRIRPNLDEMDSVVESVPKLPEISEISDVVSGRMQAAQEAAAAPEKQTYGWNRELVSQLYGEPDDMASSYSAALAYNTQEQLKAMRNGNDAKMRRLQAEEAMLLEKAAAYSATQREEKDTKGVRISDISTLENAITKNRTLALQDAGFAVDLETNISEALTGKEGRGYSAILGGVAQLENSWGTMSDPMVNARLNQEKLRAENGLIRYANQTVLEDQRNAATEQYMPKSKTAASREEFAAGMKQGEYKIGDVIVVNDNGKMQVVVYTGVPGNPVIYAGQR